MAYETANRMPAGDPAALRSGVAVLFRKIAKKRQGDGGRSLSALRSSSAPREPYLPDFQRRRPYQVVV